jgi:Ca-activated chloride channel family protein
MLILLLAVPVLVMLYLSLQRRRAQVAARYGNLSGLASLVPEKQIDFKRHVPPVLFLFAIGVMIIALARPQTVVSLPRLQGTVILAFDVSGSMKADDLQPTRMDAAKEAARAFVDKQPTSVQVGVVAFSDSGLAVQQPSIDKKSTLDAIERLVPQRGTSLANGIFASLSAIEVATRPAIPRYYTNATPEPTPSPTPVPQGTHLPAVIVLLTDGENNENPDPMLAAQAAAERGVRIYTVGIGSPQGADLHIEGFIIHSQLNEPLLLDISAMTGGEYYNAATTERLLEIYGTLGQQLIVKPEETEITSLFAAASILILLTAGTISFLWFGRML